MRVRLLGLGLAAAVFAGTAACDEDISTLAGPTPNLKPTFSSIQTEIFNTTDSSGRLACITCHNPAGRPFTAGLDLASAGAYARLVGVASVERPSLQRVAPGDPENSYLVHKLEGQPGIVGVRMPRGTGPFLSDGQMRIIRRWIELGANND
jgi:hypothetical protein